MRVYYFTSCKHALDNLENKRIRVSLFDELNDPFELMSIDMRKSKDRRHFKRIKKKLTSEYGVICFSRVWSNPVLWSHYADKHRGICLGFDIPKSRLTQIDYKGKRLVSTVERTFSANYIDQEIMQKILATKYEDWRYEKEFRYILRLDNTESTSRHYFKSFEDELKLLGVIVGARCNIAKTTIQGYLSGYHGKVELTKARLAFKSFRVVPNRTGFR